MQNTSSYQAQPWIYYAVWFIIGVVVSSCRFDLPQLPETDAPNVALPDAGPLPFNLEVLAGDIGGTGNADGVGAAARFNSPYGVAIDNGGNVYVADSYNHTIRKITAAGVVTTLAGTAGTSGSTDGTGAAARFYYPHGVVVNSGNIYIADSSTNTIRKVTAAGVVTTLAGTAGPSGSTDGTGAAARFNIPSAVAVDSVGNVYVADSGNNTIRKVTAAGVVTTLAGTAGPPGSTDGMGAAARFYGPYGVAVDSARNVYVADTNNHIIRKITAAGDVTTLAGTAGTYGSADGTGAAARFGAPTGLAVDSADNVYVADSDNNTIRKITPAGVVTTLVGTAGTSGSADGTGTAALFSRPHGVVVDSVGNIYVADLYNHTIRKVTAAQVVTTLAGAAGKYGNANGTVTSALFFRPPGVAVDSAGNVYVADSGNNTIRKITAAGVVTTLAGAASTSSGSTDGTGAAARFNHPSGVAVDSAGNTYVADRYNHTIRRVTAAGVVTTLAGTAGTPGSMDGTGAAARFSTPSGVAVDSAGNVYVADQYNSTIRKVTAAGTTTTIAGMVGMQGIALGGTPRLASPIGLATIGDSIIISDTNAILLLRHGAQ